MGISPDGSHLACTICLPDEVLNLTHVSSPRYFAGWQRGSNDTPIQQGIYLADVVYAGNHPTGVSNLRLLIENPRGLCESPDSSGLVHGRHADPRIYSLATGVSRFDDKKVETH